MRVRLLVLLFELRLALRLELQRRFDLFVLGLPLPLSLECRHGDLARQRVSLGMTFGNSDFPMVIHPKIIDDAVTRARRGRGVVVIICLPAV